MFKPVKVLIYLILFIFIMSCDSQMLDGNTSDKMNEADDYTSAEDGGDSSSPEGSDIDEQGNGNFEAGVVTAGEWNDLNNWDFWLGLFSENYGYGYIPEYWHFYTNNRVSVLVENSEVPVVDILVELKRSGTTVWTARTNNTGEAELWVSLFQEEDVTDTSTLSLWVDGTEINQEVSLIVDGINNIEWNSSDNTDMVADIAFVVDATGSMGDELDFLKEDLQSVIQTVVENNQNLSLHSGAVFYRDEGDAYVTRSSDFSAGYSDTVNFISLQSAQGGGDFPEAVHSALTAALDLSWHTSAQARLMFLLLDAPPHHNTDVITSLQNSVKEAAERGIRIIPISASGIDKDTEFLMRHFSIVTDGTYVFITDHSGVGGDHLEPTIGSYQVELLNDLLVRLIQQYTE